MEYEIDLILKYFSIGTIDSVEVEKYEYNNLELNISTIYLTNGDIECLDLIFTEDEIKCEKILKLKDKRNITIEEKTLVIGKLLKEINSFYNEDFHLVIYLNFIKIK